MVEPYAVARAACDVLDEQVGGSGTHGDAVVASGDVGVGDGHSRRPPDVNSIGVGAFIGCGDFYILEFCVAAAVDDDVEHLAIYGS